MESSGFGQTFPDASRRPCAVTDSKLERNTGYWVKIYPADSIVHLFAQLGPSGLSVLSFLFSVLIFFTYNLVADPRGSRPSDKKGAWGGEGGAVS